MQEVKCRVKDNESMCPVSESETLKWCNGILLISCSAKRSVIIEQAVHYYTVYDGNKIAQLTIMLHGFKSVT